jgi:hypothetical protein
LGEQEREISWECGNTGGDIGEGRHKEGKEKEREEGVKGRDMGLERKEREGRKWEDLSGIGKRKGEIKR